MRNSIERDLPDTEPYQELLAVMGSIIVVLVGLTVLLSQGVLSKLRRHLGPAIARWRVKSGARVAGRNAMSG